jgi:hypothetical protein
MPAAQRPQVVYQTIRRIPMVKPLIPNDAPLHVPVVLVLLMTHSGSEDTIMAKGEQRGNREKKKPKKEKPKVIAAAPSMKGVAQSEAAKSRRK